MLMYCDLWPKESKIEQYTGLLLATLQYVELNTVCIQKHIQNMFINLHEMFSLSKHLFGFHAYYRLQNKNKLFLLFLTEETYQHVTAVGSQYAEARLGQAIGPLWGFCAPISVIVQLQD